MESRGHGQEIGEKGCVADDGRAGREGAESGDGRAARRGAESGDGGAARATGGAENFLDAFDVFVQAVRRARGNRTRDRERALTLSQYGLLEPLADADGARVRELAEQAGIAPSTATRILDALERRGIVERRPSAGDRRGVRVTLTAAGRAVLRDEDDWLRAREREFYARLPDDERRLAPDLLLRMAALIDEMAAGPAADGEPETDGSLPAVVSPATAPSQ